jgi:hypothetical protein
MPEQTPPPPELNNEGYLASGPRRNTQFGQEIGVDDTDLPQVDHGQRVARESELVEDRYAGVRARFVRPMDRRPPPQEASEASEFGQPETGPPTADAALPDDLPSVWDASPPLDGGGR